MKITSKTILIWALLLLTAPYLQAQNANLKIKNLHQRYIGKWPKTMTYIEEYIGNRFNTTWNVKNYHAASFPDKFRVDLENIDDGNAEITVGKTLYTFRKFKNKDEFSNHEVPFTEYIVGHLYFDSPEVVIQRFKSAGIDLNKTFTTTWKGRKVIVIGANTAETSYNQIWYDAEGLFPVRRLEMVGRHRDDYQYTIKQSGGSWFPIKFIQFRNSRLIYERNYSQIKTNVNLDPEIFSIENFGSTHWYQAQP